MPRNSFDPSRFRKVAEPANQYRRQLERLATDGKQVDCIEQAVDNAIANLAREGRASFVIYGEPQSGKTEMMIHIIGRPAASRRTCDRPRWYSAGRQLAV